MRTNPMEYPRFHDLNIRLMDKWMEAVERYKEDCGINKFEFQWPKQYGWEELRMKRFLCDSGEQFGNHVDVLTREGAKRFLILMVYLNDDFDGGETEFPVFGDKVKPEKGKLVVFPPLWQYMHRGNPPTNGHAKYFLMTYLNYVRT